MSTVTPEKIDSARYPYFSPKAPLIGTLAIALRCCQKNDSYTALGFLRQRCGSRDCANCQTNGRQSRELSSARLLERKNALFCVIKMLSY